MEFHFVPPDLRRVAETSAEVVACSMWKDERPMRGLAGLLDWRLAGKLSALARADYLVGELGEVLCVPPRPRLPFDKLLVFGLGNKSGFGEGTFREVTQHILRALEGLAVRRAVVELPGRAEGLVPPERATELVLECLGTSEAHDAWWLVEDIDAERRMTQRAQEEQRRARRG
jgi:Cytosol aminopeptidase family, N-terminal domain